MKRFLHKPYYYLWLDSESLPSYSAMPGGRDFNTYGHVLQKWYGNEPSNLRNVILIDVDSITSDLFCELIPSLKNYKVAVGND